MKLAFVLHLYQPPQQHSYVLEEVLGSCYLPLFKLFKTRKDVKVTFNTPLSLLEWFEKQHADSILNDLKYLVDNKRAELLGSGAYHPILTKIPEEEAERQIILNEAGVGYYLGQRSGFEGEPSFVVRNLKGFFPPELAMSENLGRVLNGLGYEWVIVDEVCTREGVGKNIFRLAGANLKLVVRNRGLSLCLSSKRDSDPADFLEGLRFSSEVGHGFAVIALDGETFGHHNREGIALFENLIDSIVSEGHTFSLVSDIVSSFESRKEISMTESSWGASDKDMEFGNRYPMWYINGNKFHDSFVRMEIIVFGALQRLSSKQKRKHLSDTLSNLPIWSFNVLSNSPELTKEEKDLIKAEILFCKALNSDKYWWSSSNPYFDSGMVRRSIELFMRCTEKIQPYDSKIAEEVRGLRDNILGELKSKEIV